MAQKNRRVKAAVMTGPGKMEIQHFPYPELEEGSMLMKMELSGVCGTDKHSYLGQTKQYAGTEVESDVNFPIIPGHENVGTVAEITDGARKNIEFFGRELKVGDRVVMCPDVVCGRCWYCRHIHSYPWCENMKDYGVLIGCKEPPHLFGGWSEYMYIMPNVYVYKVPDAVPPEAAVLTELFAVTYTLDKAKEFSSLPGEGFGSADTVVIMGAAPLGLCHVIKARILGAGDIIVTDKSGYRLKAACEFGADVALNVDETAREERIDKVKSMTGGRGADLVIDCAGVPDAFLEGFEYLRRGGMYLEPAYFVDTGTVPINPHKHICAKNVRMIGITNHPATGYGPTLKLMEKYGAQFDFSRLVTHKYKLDQAEEAIRKSMEFESLKVALEP